MRFLPIVVCLSLVTPVAADTVVLSPDRDNTLFEDIAGSKSSAAGPNLFAGRTAGGSVRRALLHFDVSSIPPGSTVHSVSLALRMNKTRGGTLAHTLHRVEADWGNGMSGAGAGGGGDGAAATTNDPTWLHRFFNAQMWSQPGGDFDPTALATTNVGNVGTYTWTTNPALVAVVQAWVDSPATNFGFLLRGGESSNQTAKRFDSKEGATPPALAIDFTPVSAVEPSTWTRIKDLYRN